MSFGEPAVATGEYIKPEQLNEHLIILWPVGYKAHIQTKFTRPDKPSDGIIVDLVDLTQQGADGTPGKEYRCQTFMQARLIQALRPAIGNGPMLGTIRKGISTNGMNPPWEFVSLTGSPEAVSQAQAWIDAHPEFVPTTREQAEMERAPRPQQNQGWPDGAVPAQQFQQQQGQPLQQPQTWGQPQPQQWGQPQPQQGWSQGQQYQQPVQQPPAGPPQGWQPQGTQMPPLPPQNAQGTPPQQQISNQAILDRLRAQQNQTIGGSSGEQQQFGY